MSSPERFWAERPVKVMYLSCGCVVWLDGEHTVHPGAEVVGIETRNVKIRPDAR